MASRSISARLLAGLWLILVHLTLTSAFTCPPKDAFDWDSVSFTSSYVEDNLTPCRSPHANTLNGPLAMMQCFVRD